MEVHLQISLSYWHQRRYEDTIAWANKALALDPRHPHAREFLAGAYLRKGDFSRYVAENIKHAQSHGAPPDALEHLRRACEAEGPAGMIRRALDRAAANPGLLPEMQLAIFHGEAGDLDAAFHHLGRAIDQHDPALVYLAVAPQWDKLRGDPRFHQCLQRTGLPSKSPS